jgi:S1-C subfamily serine protease
VRLGPERLCQACLSQDAWSHWQHEGKLVIDRAEIEAAEARERGIAKRKLLGAAGSAATALLSLALSGLCAYLVIGLFEARPLGPPAKLAADLRAASRVAIGCGLGCLVVSLLALRLPPPRRGRIPLVAGRLIGVVCGAGAAILAGFTSYFTGPPHSFERLTMPDRPSRDLLSGPAARVTDATVVIVAPDSDGDARFGAIGTGAVVAAYADRALVVTCSHVAMPSIAVAAWHDAASAQPLWIQLADGRESRGRVIWTANPPLDVALVEVHITTPPEPVPILSSTEAVAPDEAVFYVPNPYRRGFRVDHGKVLRREAHDTPAGRFNLLFTNLPVRPGDSGSGLFDARGRLIGLNTWWRNDPTEPQGISLPAEALAEIARVMQEGAQGSFIPPSPRDPPLEKSP